MDRPRALSAHGSDEMKESRSAAFSAAVRDIAPVEVSVGRKTTFGSFGPVGMYARALSEPEALSLKMPLPVKVRLYGRPARAMNVMPSRVSRSSPKKVSANEPLTEKLCGLE